MAEQHVFEIEMPDGAIVEVEAPANTPREKIMSFVQAQLGGKDAAEQPKVTPEAGPWSPPKAAAPYLPLIQKTE